MGAAWEHPLTAGLLAVCPAVELEVLHTARSKAHRDELVQLLRSAFARVPMPGAAFDRCAQVQGLLTDRGKHRCAGVVDLLVASAAELHSLTLLHYDHDFVQVAETTGQPAVWIAPAGSVD